jgi:hypothetical protein
MEYRIIVTPEGLAKMGRLPPEILALIPDHFARLAASPTSVSIPGAPPASLPDRMIYPFPVSFPDGRTFTVRVHFKYGTDEQTLWVSAVTAIQHT